MHHYNCIWGPCSPSLASGLNMHHQAAMCTMVHKGEYIFWKIQGSQLTDAQSVWYPHCGCGLWSQSLLPTAVGLSITWVVVYYIAHAFHVCESKGGLYVNVKLHFWGKALWVKCLTQKYDTELVELQSVLQVIDVVHDQQFTPQLLF